LEFGKNERKAREAQREKEGPFEKGLEKYTKNGRLVPKVHEILHAGSQIREMQMSMLATKWLVFKKIARRGLQPAKKDRSWKPVVKESRGWGET